MNDSVRLIVAPFFAAMAALTLASCSNTAVGVRTALDVPAVGSTGRGAIVSSDFSTGTSYGLAFESDLNSSVRGRIETSLRFASSRSELGTIQGNANNPRPISGFLDAHYQLIDIPLIASYQARVSDVVTPFFGIGGLLSLGRSLTWNSQYSAWSLNDNNEWYRYSVTDEHSQGALQTGVSALVSIGASVHLTRSIDAQFDVRLTHRLTNPSVEARWASVHVEELFLPITHVIFGGGIMIRL